MAPRPNLGGVHYKLLSSSTIYLFDESWVLFSYWRVKAIIEKKTGSVSYRGPFTFERRPAQWISFPETDRLAAAIGNALESRAEEMSFADYKKISRKGDPVLLEFKLKSKTELGKRAYYFVVEDFGGWFRVYGLPWKQGQFWPWPDWERIVRVTPSRRRALQRVALTLQTEFPPRGFEFKAKAGLVPEKPAKYRLLAQRAQRTRTKTTGG